MPDALADRVEVRIATADDLDGVAASQAALFALDAGTRDGLRNLDWPATHGSEWIAGLIGRDDALVLVAARGDKVVGHLVATSSPPSDMWVAARAELVSMHVDESQRGGGVGSRLVSACIGWAREQGAARLAVSAYAANDGAVRFYQANGFEPFSLELTQLL